MIMLKCHLQLGHERDVSTYNSLVFHMRYCCGINLTIVFLPGQEGRIGAFKLQQETWPPYHAYIFQLPCYDTVKMAMSPPGYLRPSAAVQWCQYRIMFLNFGENNWYPSCLPTLIFSSLIFQCILPHSLLRLKQQEIVRLALKLSNNAQEVIYNPLPYYQQYYLFNLLIT